MFRSLRCPNPCPRRLADGIGLPLQGLSGQGTWDYFAELWLQERALRVPRRRAVSPPSAPSRQPAA